MSFIIILKLLPNRIDLNFEVYFVFCTSTTEISSIKLTGSVATSLLPYLVQNTDLIERFIDKDARCAYIPEDVGIDLITNPHVAVEGALFLATKSSR